MTTLGSPSPQTTQVIGLLRWLLIAVFVVVGWMTLSYMAGVLAPILAALGIAYMLNPVLERLVKAGMSRSLGAGILLVLFVALVVVGLITAVSAIVHQVQDVATDLPRMMNNLDLWLHGHFDFGLPEDWRSYLTREKLEHTLTGGPMRTFATAAVGGILAFVAHAAEFLLVPVFAFYFLVDWPNMLRRIDTLVPPRKRRGLREMATEIDRVVAGWVRGQAIVTAILAVLYAIAFTIVGMPLSVPIGIVVGVLTIIPFVGTLVGALIAAAVTIAGGGSFTTLAEVGGVILVLHVLEAGVLTPKIVGHRVGLSESGALFAVVAGGKLLGFVGIVLAVPIAATVAVLVRYAVRYYEHTEFFGREADADVVITPAMALIMPGVKLERLATISDGELKPSDGELKPTGGTDE